MGKYIVLSNEFGCEETSITTVTAKNVECACEDVECTLLNSNTRAWVMTRRQFIKLRNDMNKVVLS